MMQGSGGSVSGSFRDVRGQMSHQGSLRHSQNPNTSYGSQRNLPGNPGADPNISIGSIRNAQNMNTSMGSIRGVPSAHEVDGLKMRIESRQGSLHRERSPVHSSSQVERTESLQGSQRNKREAPANYQQQQRQQNYSPQQPPAMPQHRDYTRDTKMDSLRSNTGQHRQVPPNYPPAYSTIDPHQHSPTGQEYQPTPTGPRGASGRSARDYASQAVGSRPGNGSNVQGAPVKRDPRMGSAKSPDQGIGARNRRSTGSSIYGMLVEGQGLSGSNIAGLLQHGFVLLTGGRDLQGGPVITLPSLQNRSDPSPDEVVTCLQYLIQIPSEETKRLGFSVVLDTRDGSWANLNMVTACLQKTVSGYLKQVLVVLHENDKRAIQDRPSNSDPSYITVNQLQRYIDPKQLTFDLGGRMEYNHSIWLRTRLNYEQFLKDAQNTVEHLDTQEEEIQLSYNHPDPQASPLEALRKHRHFQDVIMTVPTEVIHQGQDLLKSLQENGYSGYSDNQGMIPTLDNLEAQKQVKRVLQYLTNRVDKLQEFLEDRDRSLNANMQYAEWKRNVKVVVDWVLGPGEKLLASQNDIGDSYEAAEELRKRHEEMEIKCTDTYGQYAELRHTVDATTTAGLPIADDMKAERDYMDTVCRSFATRLERRRTLLITSVRFHRFAEELSTCLDELLELFSSEVEADTVEAVEEAMKTLQAKCDNCDRVAEQSLNDGQSLLDEMSRPIKNAFGKDISPDYSNQIKHVNKRLENLQERKMRCDELADVRRLKLQQLLQLRTCERDTDQAINWINELCDVMVTSHTDMGQSSEEVEALHDDHKKFEATALGTYEYGKQLLQAALVLRRSLRYDIEPNYDRAQRLEEAWRRFSKGTSERANRLTVLALFLNESDKLMNNMDNFISACAKALAGEENINNAVRNLNLPKVQIGKDFDNTCQMAQALVERLALPIILYEGDEKRLSIDEEGASDTVNNCLKKLDRKMAETDTYWDELLKAQADPNFQPRTGWPLERAPSERRKERPLAQKPKPRLSSDGEERKRRIDPLGIAAKRRQEPGQKGARPVPIPRRHVPASADATNMTKPMDSSSSQEPPRNQNLRGSLYPTASDQQKPNQSFESGPGDTRGYQGQVSPHARTGHSRQNSDIKKGLSLDPNQNIYTNQQPLKSQPYPDTNDGGIKKEEVLKVGAAPSDGKDPVYSNEPQQSHPQRSLLDLDWSSPMYDPRSPLKKQLEQMWCCICIFFLMSC